MNFTKHPAAVHAVVDIFTKRLATAQRRLNMVETLTKGMALRIGVVVYQGKSSRHSVEAYKWEALRHGRLACQGKSLRHGGGAYHEVHGRLEGQEFCIIRSYSYIRRRTDLSGG